MSLEVSILQYQNFTRYSCVILLYGDLVLLMIRGQKEEEREEMSGERHNYSTTPSHHPNKKKPKTRFSK